MKSQTELFEDVARFLETNRSSLQQGDKVELAGLDEQVQKLCEGVLKLSDDERLKYADSFRELLNELTLLGEQLTVQKEALAHEMRYLSSHKKANVAYKVADAKAPVDDEGNG